nr:collagen-like protein [uncultured Acidocella sp.]
MTTIAQLPSAATVGASDLLPISQNGSVYSATVAQVTASLQPLIEVSSGALLGRVSLGTGTPEAVAVGTGLALSGGVLAANGADHASYPVQAALALTDELVINTAAGPGLLPVSALTGLFSAGQNVSITAGGVISVNVSAVAGPVGPMGPAGPAGPAGPTGPTGAAGAGLQGPAVGTATSSVSSADYLPLWQNGALAWIPYGQLLAGQTVDELPAAAPATDGDELLVAQGSNTLSVQSFGSIWTYVQGKLPSVQSGVVELTTATVLDSTAHNQRVLVASAPLTLTANFANTGAGFACTLINLSAGAVTMGTGIRSGTGGTVLPPGASTQLVGISYSGGSTVWWSGIVSNTPTITVGAISAPAVNTAFVVGGGIFNDAVTALDYSTNGGGSWTAAPSPVISANAYSFTLPGLAAGTYTVQVRDHGNQSVVGVSNSFTVAAPTIAFTTMPTTGQINAPLNIAGTVSPGGTAVQVGLSSSATTAPGSWNSATVNGTGWSASLTPSAAGSFYVWAQQTADTAVQVVSGAVNVTQASLTISAPASGTAGSALSLSGAVTPVGDAVNIQLTTSNSTVPTSGWVAAANNAGAISGALTPSAAGTYYAWAQDPSSGLTAVSSAITVTASAAVSFGFNNPGGSYTHGSGTIGLNGAISPAQAVSVQVALSTSNSTAPTSGWQAASVIDSNTLWAIYYTSPATAGAYYVWVQTTAGAATAVSSFTVTVS